MTTNNNILLYKCVWWDYAGRYLFWKMPIIVFENANDANTHILTNTYTIRVNDTKKPLISIADIDALRSCSLNKIFLCSEIQLPNDIIKILFDNVRHLLICRGKFVPKNELKPHTVELVDKIIFGMLGNTHVFLQKYIETLQEDQSICNCSISRPLDSYDD